MADASTAVFDFRTVADVTTGEHKVTLPGGQPTPMVILLAGPEHPDRKARAFAVVRRKRAELKRTGEMPLGDPEEDFALETDELVASTLGWKGCAVDFSRQAALELYTDPERAWLRGQVKEALSRRELFIQRSGGA